jgi:hypothetical protein
MKASGCFETSVYAKLRTVTSRKDVLLVIAMNLKIAQELASPDRRLSLSLLTVDFCGFSTKFGIRFHLCAFPFAKKC